MSRGAKLFWKILSALILLQALFSCSTHPEGIIILCAGDSITEAAYPRYLQRILRDEGIKARVLNYGRSGHTSGEYLDFLLRNRERLASEFPDFILLQLGTNDVREDGDFTFTEIFRKNIQEILMVFKGFKTREKKGSRILLATIPPIPKDSSFPFSAESERRVREEINPTLKEICQGQRLTLVDNYSLFLDAQNLLPEVHPSAEGYRQLAHNWYRALKPFIESSRKD